MNAKKKLNFTHRGLHKLPPAAEGKRDSYFDEKISNLCIIVTDKGSKSFYVRKVIEGRSRRILLGGFPDLSVENARELALDVKNDIAKGKNPFEQRKRLKEEPTFADFFDHYMNKHAKVYKKPHSIRGDECLFRVHIKPELGSKRISSITQEDIQRLHSKAAKNAQEIKDGEIIRTGEYAANRVLALTRAIFNKAQEWGYLEKKNPALHIKPFKEKSRRRFLQKDEVPRFLQALEQEPNEDIRDYVLLSLFTGARQSNVLSMRWQDVHLDREEWYIEETKNGEPQIIPLIPQAIELLQQRQNPKEVSPFVFPSSGRTGHLVEPKSGWRRILKRAEIDNFRLHDLRRTLASYQAGLGTSLHIIGETLGHKSLTATKIYSRLSGDPVRESMQNAINSIFSQGERTNV